IGEGSRRGLSGQLWRTLWGTSSATDSGKPRSASELHKLLNSEKISPRKCCPKASPRKRCHNDVLCGRSTITCEQLRHAATRRAAEQKSTAITQSKSACRWNEEHIPSAKFCL